MNTEGPPTELHSTASGATIGTAWMRLEYVEFPEEEEIVPPLTFWQRVWFILNMDIRDIWRLIRDGVKSIGHHRAG